MRTLIEDLRFAARLLVKSPGFTFTALATLVIGIVLNTAAFGVVNALWYSPLPFRDDAQIHVLSGSNPAKGLFALTSYADYTDIAAQSRAFEGFAAFSERTFNLTLPVAGAQPERVRGGAISSAAFEMLGFRPIVGRGFTAEEEGSWDTVSGPRAVLIGEGLWRNRFGADPGVLGRVLKIDGNAATIVGVLPYSFRFVYGGYQVVAPLPREVVNAPRVDRSLQVLARLRHGAAPAQEQTELTAVAGRLAEQYPASNDGWTVAALPYRQAVFSDAMRMYPVLLAAAGLVLLIVCANVSNLLLAKAAARKRDVAIRIALGSGRVRIVRQILTEGVLIALAGAALALVSAAWVRSILIANYPELAVLRVDYRVLAYTLGAGLIAGLVFAIAPALSASKTNLNEALKSGGRGFAGRGYRLRGALVVSQLAFALMLLTGAGLLVKTVTNLRQIDTGFDMRNLLTAQISLEGPKYMQLERRAQFWRQLNERLSGLPGVEAVAMASNTPLLAGGVPQRVEVEGRPTKPGGDYVRLVASTADSGYIRTAGVRLLAGRDFGPPDAPGAPRVAIVNETFAKLLSPGDASRALGQRIRVGDDAGWATIVGIVSNARQLLMEPPFPEVMTPAAQAPTMSVLVRAQPAAQNGLAEAIRREVRALDADMPIGELLTMPDIVEKFYPRVMIGGLGICSLTAITLAAIGLCGVISFLVNCRTQEIGVRIALGAGRGSILRMVIGQAVRLASIGLGLGVAGALIVARVLSGFIYGMKAMDPAVVGVVSAVLVAVAVAASWIPAWRAAHVDPVVALRHD